VRNACRTSSSSLDQNSEKPLPEGATGASKLLNARSLASARSRSLRPIHRIELSKLQKQVHTHTHTERIAAEDGPRMLTGLERAKAVMVEHSLPRTISSKGTGARMHTPQGTYHHHQHIALMRLTLVDIS
jgi:hypothetical protein